ncbi:MAG: phosphotransferase, partial [Bacteroidota bacterium]
WIAFLQSQQLPVVGLIPSVIKQDLEKIGSDEHFTVVCFEKIEGEKVTASEWNEQHFQKLGQLVGKLHSTQKENSYDDSSYKHWDEIVEFENYKRLAEIQPDYLDIHNILVEEFRSYDRSKENYGIIHYDIHHGNYLLVGEEKKLVLFDFEMASKSWYANDIACVVYYAKHFPPARDEDGFEDRFLNEFWKGYELENCLEEREKEKIPKFLLYRDLVVLAFLRKIWDFENISGNEKAYVAMIEQSITKRRIIISG